MSLESLGFMRLVGSAVLCVVVGGYYFFSGISEWNTDRTLKNVGIAAEARVIEVTKTDEGRHGRKSYYAELSFKTEEGHFVHAYPKVQSDFMEAHRPPDNYIDILYLPEHPETIHIKGEPWVGNGVKSLIGLASVALGLFLGWTGLRGVEGEM